ncbi:MAG: tyrosine--tRNA ligase [Planctomycetaceae bacterium]|nr:tyrosine--tRNA ligase [Planctomycetaceae bacterium]
MSQALTDIFANLQWRQLVYQCTSDRMGSWLLERPRTVYAGFDPTSDSLHVGHLLPLLMLRRFQKSGHRPIALVGGATGSIGDPSGKSQERNLQSLEQIEANVVAIRGQMAGLLDFSSDRHSTLGPALLVNNYDWISRFSYLDFLRDVGKNVPVNVMINKDSVKNRLENPDVGISYTEFSYMLLQAYDFVHLNRTFGCELQLGGSDQWGNVTAGIDLARRMSGAEVFGMTCPLLTKSDGTKMGKTESGALWLDGKKTAPYQFYQYWRNVADEDAGKCLRFLTELPREEVEHLDHCRATEPEKAASQIRLAEWLTELIHGTSALDLVRQATEIFFGGEIGKFANDEDLNQVFAEVPSSQLSAARLAEGLSIADALVEAKLTKSKGEARRVVAEGGAYVNNRRIESDTHQVTTADLSSPTMIVLRRGKKNYALLRIVD